MINMQQKAGNEVTQLFINAVGLLDDGLHLATFTDQPGDNKALQ